MTVAKAELHLLSQSTNGKGILLDLTATPGSHIHTAADGSYIDLLTLWVVNTSSNIQTVTFEWGGTTSPDNVVEQKFPAKQGFQRLEELVPLAGGEVLRAFASTDNVVVIYGKVTRSQNV